MRFLLICMQYPVSPGHSYMTTELADALIGVGHEVEVLHMDWSAPPDGPIETLASPTGVRVVRCPPNAVTGMGRTAMGASKFVLTGRRAARIARRAFDLSRIDAVVTWMPAIAAAPLLPMIRRAGVRRRLLFIWDFFPDHHHQIGLIPAGLPFRAARAWEQRLLAHFTTILCTLPSNADYLRRSYRLSPDQQVKVTPIWSDTSPRAPVDRAAVRARYGLPPDRPIAVFGGQIVEGRGFEQMLGAADAAQAAGSPLVFLFVGGGRLVPMLEARARTQDNVVYLPPMPREAYLELVGACDVGMLATVPGVTSYSIPTKTIDYLRAGLPVIAALEHGSDFVPLLESYGVGTGVAFKAMDEFHQLAERLAVDPAIRATARQAAPRCLDEVFDVRHAVAAVLEAAS